MDPNGSIARQPAPPPPTSDGIDPNVLLSVLSKVSAGDLTARMPSGWTGVAGEVAEGIDALIVANQAKDLLEREAVQLAVSSKYKSEFIANMSHEIRMPLNSLLILAEQLEDNPGGTMTESQVEYASVIRSSGNDLLALLNTILDLAKAESGTMIFEKTNVSVMHFRDGFVRDFTHIARVKSLTYSFEIAENCPTHIVTDPLRLGQILKNLLSNAFKFTEEGHVKVHMRLEDEGWSTDHVELNEAPSVLAISVSDTGIGVDPESLSRIFEAFAQGDGSTARLYGGTGLGLSISRELVGLLDGELTVVSSPDVGSTFTLYLPLEAVAAPASVPTAAPQAPGTESEWPPKEEGHEGRLTYALEQRTFAGTRVLVVDDDHRNIFAMRALLERGEAVVTSAESGAEALEMLRDGPPVDIVLMDIMMPVMDGYETIRALRQIPGFEKIPVIAVTGKVMSGERQRCLDAGANDYVPKPVDTQDLLATITPWLPPLSGAFA
jgi:two-component system chemotaxis sensor kinase CheA